MNQLLDLIGEIYEASFKVDHWSAVMTSLCKVFSANSAAICMEDYEHSSRQIIGSQGIPSSVQMAYRLGISKYDLTFQLQEKSPLGLAQQIVDAQMIRKEHPFYYRLILKPNNIGYMAAMAIYRDHAWHVGVALHRTFDSAPFSDEELSLLHQLFPHFQRALRIQKEFYKLRNRQLTLQSALSHLTIGVITLNPNGTVSDCNPIASQLLKQHGALQISPLNGLQGHIQQDHYQLQRAIKHLIQADPHDINTKNVAMCLHHPNRSKPLTLILFALSTGSPQNSVVIYLSDAESSLHLSPNTLSALYGLTCTESAVAIALANGLSPNEISQHHGVSIETVRSQLKNIYAKMGVNKQQDVIRILLSGALQTSN